MTNRLLVIAISTQNFEKSSKGCPKCSARFWNSSDFSNHFEPASERLAQTDVKILKCNFQNCNYKISIFNHFDRLEVPASILRDHYKSVHENHPANRVAATSRNRVARTKR